MSTGGNVSAEELQWAIREAELLVQRLYSPRTPPDEIRAIDAMLKPLQRSDAAFEIAAAFLDNHEDMHIRFFGALTFIVKINRDWKNLDSQKAQTLLDRLLDRLGRFVADGDAAIVVQKICAALVAVFLQSEGQWQGCVAHVIACLHAQSVVPNPHAQNNDGSAATINQTGDAQIEGALWFCTSLAETVSQLGTNSRHQHHEHMLSNLADMVNLIQRGFDAVQSQNFFLAERSITFYQSLVFSVQRKWITGTPWSQALRRLAEPVIHFLREDDLFDAAQDFVSEVISNFELFFLEEHYIMIANAIMRPEGRSRLQALIGGEYDGFHMAYAKLLLAYGEARIEDLVHNPTAPILSDLLSLTFCKGHSIAEDPVIPMALDFWSTFVEYALTKPTSEDLEDTKNPPEWLKNARYCVEQVTQSFIMKIAFPDVQTYELWDDETKEGFRYFRRDFKSYIASAYTLLGTYLFDGFISYAVGMGNQKEWEAMEAAMFCIVGVADSAGESEDSHLSILFGSDLFAIITNPVFGVPEKVQQTAINVIAEYSSFFKRHPENLVSAIKFVLRCLENPALINVAARTFQALCDDCRSSLGDQSQLFVREYYEFIASGERDPKVKQRLIAAITAVIQSVSEGFEPDGRSREREALDMLGELVQAIEGDAAQCVTHEDEQYAVEKGICAIQCLTSMGKAYRAPESTPINLDAEPKVPGEPEQEAYWEFQTRTFKLFIAVLDRFPANGDIMEAVCDLLQAGHTENTGPFVYPLQIHDHVFERYALSTQRVSKLLEMLKRRLWKHRNGHELEIVAMFAVRCLSGAFQLAERLDGDPSADPEVAWSTIDFASSYVPCYVDVLRSHKVAHQLEPFLEFTLVCLGSPEILPKQHAAAFWATLVKHWSPSEGGQAIDIIMMSRGRQLCRTLVERIGGKASRNELESLCEPLKKLCFRGGVAKKWLEEAILAEDFPSERPSPEERKAFVRTLMGLRGSYETTRVVKEFWVKCKGTFSA